MVNNNRIKKFFEERGASLIMGMLLLFFLTDATNAIVRYFEVVQDSLFFTSGLKMSTYSRGLAWIFIACLLLLSEIKNKRLWMVIATITAICLSNVYFDGQKNMFSWIIRLTKLIFPFLLWWFIQNIKIRHYRYLQDTFLILIGFELVAVFIPFIFNLDVFLSYNPSRFGYSGFIIARNEATFFYLLSSVFVLHLWEQNRNFTYFIWLLFVMAGALLLGTKAGLLVIGGVIGYLLVTNFRSHKKLVLGTAISTMGIVVVFACAFGLVDFYLTIVQEYGFWSMVTSLRSDLIAERLPIVFDNWRWYNYLLGGVNPATSFVEMDVIDLFLFGGIIGSLVYYWGLFKTLFAFKKQNYLGWFLVGMFFFIGGIAGHFFASGINSLYLVTVCWILQYELYNYGHKPQVLNGKKASFNDVSIRPRRY